MPQEDSQQHKSLSHGDITSAGRLRPPTDVRISFFLWVGVSILWILMMALIATWSAPESDTHRPRIPPEWENDPVQRQADAARAAGEVTFYLLFGLGVVIAIMLVAIRMKTGSNRARITLATIGICLALLTIVTVLANMASAAAPVGIHFIVRMLLSIGLLALVAGAISLMFRPRVSDFFRVGPDPERSEQQRIAPEGPSPSSSDHASVSVEASGDSREAPPMEVHTAFWLWIASFGMAILAAGVIYFGTTGDLSEAALLAARNRPFTFPGTDTAKLIAYVMYVGLLLFFSFKMRSGKKWARITLVVLTGFFGVLGLPPLIQIAVYGDSLYTAYVALSLLQAALVVPAIVVVFLPNANNYFRSARRPR